MIELWYFFVLSSVIAISFGEIGQKLSVTSKLNLSARTINFSIAAMQMVLASAYVLLFVPNPDFSLSAIQLLQLVFSGILSFFFFDALYSSYKGNSASISQVIFSFSAILSSILGIILFNETVTIFKFIGILLILAGVIFASIKKGEKISRYNLLALLAAFIYAILTINDKSFATAINPHVYQVLSMPVFLIVSLLFSGKKIMKEIRLIDMSLFRSILLSTIAFTISNKLTYLAYSTGGEVGRVDAINNSTVIFIIILEVLILKDKSNLRTKIIASMLTVSGVLILGLI